MNRAEIIKELRDTPMYMQSFRESQCIADALEEGLSKAMLLALTVVNNWPDTYVWLKSMLDD